MGVDNELESNASETKSPSAEASESTEHSIPTLPIIDSALSKNGTQTANKAGTPSGVSKVTNDTAIVVSDNDDSPTSNKSAPAPAKKATKKRKATGAQGPKSKKKTKVAPPPKKKVAPAKSPATPSAFATPPRKKKGAKPLPHTSPEQKAIDDAKGCDHAILCLKPVRRGWCSKKYYDSLGPGQHWPSKCMQCNKKFVELEKDKKQQKMSSMCEIPIDTMLSFAVKRRS